LNDVLDNSLNELNRPNKRLKFAFETSEDALTWTVFRYLQEHDAFPQALGMPAAPLQAILFWGTECPIVAGSETRAALLQIQQEVIQEVQRRLSEPDVILVFQDLLIFIEVKYGAGNDVDKNNANFDRYLDHAAGLFEAAHENVAEMGYYELTRNWVIGNLVAHQLDREFRLINLGSARCQASAGGFRNSLANGGENFSFLTWLTLIGNLPQPLDDWFATYLQAKAEGLG